MSAEPSYFIHACYVAFVFSVLFFGTLAFRQGIDNMSVRQHHLGEDRDGFLDARAVVFLIVFMFVSMAFSVTVLLTFVPSIFAYSLPMILLAESVQIAVRIGLQRTLVKTQGIIVRSVMFESVRAIRFEDIIVVRLSRGSLWVNVTIGLPSEQITFRIFLFSAETFQRMISSSCSAPVLWASSGVNEHDVHPPTSSV